MIAADHPLLRADTLKLLVAHWLDNPESIVVPVHASKRGHPTLLPWTRAADVFTLPNDVGVNHLLRTEPGSVHEVPVDDPTVTLDLDTPEDYERALSFFADEPT